MSAAELKKRTLQQNNLMWGMLTDISNQVYWHGKWEPKQWKEIVSATINRQILVPSIDGDGFVALGASTSDKSTSWLSQMIIACHAFGILHDVKFKQMPDYDDYPEAAK